MPTTKSRRGKAPAKKPRAGTGKARRARNAPAAAGRRRGPAELTPEHVQAMTNGRIEANAIKRFLVIAGDTGTRGRAANPETLRTKLERTAGKIAGTTNELRRLNLIAERMELEKALARAERQKGSAGYIAARTAFIEHAKGYSERHGIPRAAWRAMGVDVETLKAAGL